MTTIRKGKKEDLPRVLELIKELATYERAPDEVSNTVEQMEQDGFGPHPVYGLWVAENERGIVGIAIWYWRYSTWKGRRLYLEDIVVTEQERGKGIGKQLFDRVVEEARQLGAKGMVWQVLEWNEPAIHFYKKYYQASLDGEWINCSLSEEDIKRRPMKNNFI
jgi:GNAT superfamily N-acetyltransferase